MDTGEIRDTLYDTGMSKYQANAYTALLMLGQASALEIADVADVPQSRIYDVLRDLDSKGYIETFQQDSLKARLNDSEAIQSDLTNQAEQFRNAAEKIDELSEQQPIDNYVANIVKLFETVQNHAEEQIREAQTEVIAGLSPDQFAELESALREAYENGVVVNIVINTTDRSELPDPDIIEGCATEVRYRNLSGPFQVNIDRRHLFFWPYKHSQSQYGIVMDDHALSYIFYWYFQTCLWEQWETIYRERTEFPLRYTDFRRVAKIAHDFLSEERTVEVTVQGNRLSDKRMIERSGEISDVQYESVTREHVRPESVQRYAGPTTIFLNSDGETYSIGGWGAFEEDIEMQMITIESVRPEMQVMPNQM